MSEHSWVQIKTQSYSLIRQLVQSALAQPVDVEKRKSLCGTSDKGTWMLKPGTEVEALSDAHLRIAGQVITVELNRLPAHMYRALVASSSTFAQYDNLDTLYQQVRQSIGGWHQGTFVQLLEETVRAGRRPDPQPHLVVPSTYTARWQSPEIYLRVNDYGHWFVALNFTVGHISVPRHAAPVPIGLDVGLHPLTVAYTAAGETMTFGACDLRHMWKIELKQLSPAAQTLLNQLVYASGREDTHPIIDYLNWRGSRVYAEKLRLGDMNDSYVHKARRLAIHDYHFSHLPQFMYAAHIRFRRVPSWNTSRRCAACYVRFGVKIYGQRQGSRMTCPDCGQTYNVHENAARNVLITGEEL
jgi:hypothetical protein